MFAPMTDWMQVEIGKEATRRHEAERYIAQFERGMLTVSELVYALSLVRDGVVTLDEV